MALYRPILYEEAYAPAAAQHVRARELLAFSS